jgi:hypothetical protein
MIVPSVDLMDGRAVQLRRGRERVLDGGDPLERLAELSIAGEVTRHSAADPMSRPSARWCSGHPAVWAAAYARWSWLATGSTRALRA